MSAPPRNTRGRGPSRERVGTSITLKPRGRGPNSARGGRSRGEAGVSTNTKAVSVLQGLQSGSLNQRSGARGRDSATTRRQPNASNGNKGQTGLSPSVSATTLPPSSQRDYMSYMSSKFQQLKTRRDTERAKAIKDGFLADPEKKTGLDKAITPVGTCTEMCPEFERVERIVQNMVDKMEKVTNHDTGRDVPSEERMIKRFRRSAAGYDEQLPSDIRTPQTLQMTLNYLLNTVVGGEESLATVHKFVWDRTRGIRNDFSIQQVTNEDDVRIAVDCFERIARFHIISLHQLSNQENLPGENFDSHQEREQLNNTLLSLMYYYDDHRARQKFANEAEFRAYCIILELQSQQPDLEDRLQTWPQDLLQHSLVRTAFELYSAAGNTLYDQGPLKPFVTFDTAQGNAVGFWNILKSKSVTYLMACVAEIYFGQVRFVALQGLWKSIKRAPISIQAKLQDWTLDELSRLLGFDSEEQALEFCREYSLGFGSNDAGDQYLDFTSRPEMTLDKSSTPNNQLFSFGIVESKRYHRTLVAVVNGLGVAQAIREGLVMEQQEVGDDETAEDTEANDDRSLFVQDLKKKDARPDPRNPFLMLNPQAPVFTPGASTSFFFPPSRGSGQTDFPPAANDTTAVALSLSSDATRQPLTSTLGDGASLNNHTKPQFTTPPTGSKMFTATARNTASFSSSFGIPSFPASAPSSSLSSSTAPSAVKQGWPSAVINAVADSDNPGDHAEPIPTRDLDTTPLKQSPPIPFTETTNVSSANLGIEATSLNKPPSSPRPSFRTLPSVCNAEQPKALSLEIPRVTEPPPMGGKTDDSKNSRTAFSVNAKTPDRAKEPFPVSISQSLSVSSPTTNFKSKDTFEDRMRTNTSHQTSLISKIPMAEQPSSPKPIGVPPILTPKSAIPPSFTPNASPSFTSVASTKPKHKSPLGSQPPLFATDSSTKSSSPRQAATNLDKVPHKIATISFLEPRGILQQYIEYAAAVQIQDALCRFEQEGPARVAQAARRQLLSKKYFKLWYSISWRRRLNRNAINRREHLAESIRKESQRKSRRETELLAILEAQKQKQRTHMEQLLENQGEQSLQLPIYRTRRGSQQTTLAGHKRKSLQGDELSPATNGTRPRKVAKGHDHRRSKTMGGVSAMGEANSHVKAAAPSSAPGIGSSVSPGRSILLKPHHRSILHHSIGSRKMDSTHTDYFRLKALGVDPETPLIPDTKFSLERKGRSQEEGCRPTSTPTRPRTHSLSRNEGCSTRSSPVPRNTSALETAYDTSQQPQSDALVSAPDDNDDFIRQIREVRAAMSEDTEWFKTQAAQLQRDMEHQEELRRSARQESSLNTAKIARSKSNGYLVKVNGYNYAPVVPQSGSDASLSRTERRIRATGGHGLATKLISDYLPVAMSKSTRAASNREKGCSGNHRGGTRELDQDGGYTNERDKYAEDNSADMGEGSLANGAKGRRGRMHVAVSSTYRSQAHMEERRVDDEEEDGAGALRHSDAIQQQLPALGGFGDKHNGRGEESEIVGQDDKYFHGSYDEIDDADEYEDEAEYDTVDDHDADEDWSEAMSGASTLPKRKANAFYMRVRSATLESDSSPSQDYTPGGAQMSRATSGTGVSVDDALVLSD